MWGHPNKAKILHEPTFYLFIYFYLQKYYFPKLKLRLNNRHVTDLLSIFPFFKIIYWFYYMIYYLINLDDQLEKT